MLKKSVFLFCLFTILTVTAQTRIKSMFYNTLNYGSDLNSQNRTIHLKTILEDVQPDLFMICELINENASDYLYQNAIVPINSNFKKAPFKESESPATGLLQMAYYNSEKLILESTNVIPTDIRDINQYSFTLNTVDSAINPIKIEVFVTHLKAATGSDNRLKRYNAVLKFLDALDKIPQDSFVLFAGDFNFYTSNEDGYRVLSDARNTIKIIDPIDRPADVFPNNTTIGDPFEFYSSSSSYFWRNSSFSDIHSQSTRSASLNGDGAGGGMDDRFDFILMSENLKTNTNLFYIEDSYKTIGNNGNCYNSYISNTSCTGTYSQELRNALYQFSDHLPIVMSLETPVNTLSLEKNNPISFSNANIVKNSITLALKEKAKSIIIYNQLGQVVYQQKNSNTVALKIDTSTFSKGVYFLKADAHKPLKFVKN
ncbi:T9SS type A sorting domain-containing protein [Polaribacter sp. R77954]|uniref:T9SS type A sorting domain-containing protein n=1 Tax=Polaribacter sp. R77954 TaxID=3093870 RepID=UPI0037C8EE04